MKKFALALLALCLAATEAAAQPVRVEAVEAELIAAHEAAVPGRPLQLGLRLRHDPHWHTYWRNPGDSGLPTQLELSLPEGWSAGPIEWPAPRWLLVGPLANYGYEGEIVLPLRVMVPASAKAGEVQLAGRATWLMCREVCIPGEAALTLRLPVADRPGAPRHAALFEAAGRAIPREPLLAQGSADAGALSLVFERGAARDVVFFPYAEGRVQAPAPQPLWRLGAEGTTAWRLAVKLADGVDGAALEKGGFFAGPAGVLLVDGRPYELSVAKAAAPAPGGTLVATATGEVQRIGAGGTGGLLSGVLPGGGSAATTTPAGAPGDPASGTAAPGAALTLAVAVLLAVAGGVILNLMPCVFPVIGLKVLGFARHGGGEGGEHRRAARRSAMTFAAGVLVSFWGLAALLLALRGAGQSIGWGFQLQTPAFVVAMALLFVAIGLNLAGVFEVGVRLTRLGGLEAAAGGRGSPAGTFASGVLAVLVATPCTAPFMGSALGYTLGRPAAELMLVFTGLAVGMALPYLLLGWFPGALRWLPKPGRWMESFKQFLAFPMFATAAWLAWVLGQQAGIDAVLGLAIGAVLLSLAAWLYGRFVQATAAVHRVLAGALAFVSLVAALWVAWPAPSAEPAAAPAAAGEWLPWDEARVASAVAAGQPVFVDFTAAWCVSCQVNKKLVLDRAPVTDEMARRQVLRLRADWTNRDAAITAALARHGRNGVPLYLLYVPGEAAPRVLPEILTPGLVTDALAGIR